ncbi:MAG: (Fe-S)-binding protein, partial [Acidobacteriota bacterium]|nr:(Fe-S)-binding protein [Acidobacteriota bacterium]
LAEGELQAVDVAAPTVTFQDPCRLGRHLGVTQAPRRVLEALAGADCDGGDRSSGANGGLVEMERSGQDANCCGTSGFIHCDANSRRLQSERLASAAATGADTLVTACPKCLIHFRCAQSEDRRTGRPDSGIEIEDLTVLAAAALDRARPDAGGIETKERGGAS